VHAFFIELWRDMEWGTVPAGIGTILTACSILIAAVSYRRSILNDEREQASKVNAWAEPGLIVVKNSSDLPVRYVEVSWDGHEQHTTIVLQPDSKSAYPHQVQVDTPVDLTFLDANGVWWRRDRSGLTRLKGMPEALARLLALDSDSDEGTPFVCKGCGLHGRVQRVNQRGDVVDGDPASTPDYCPGCIADRAASPPGGKRRAASSQKSKRKR